MTPTDLLRTIEAVVVIAGLGAIIVAVFKSKTTAATIEQQRELISAQKERLDLLEKQHIENARAIGELQGEVNAYKKIPLENIAKSIKDIASTNSEILKLIQEKS